MTRNSDLEALVGLLKRAVIDLYMKEEGWAGRADGYYVEEIDWGEKHLPIFHDQAKACIRPNEWGLHGGDVFDSLDDAYRPGEKPVRAYSYVAKFEEIGGRVDDALDRWYDLPDPAEISQGTAAYTAVVDQLCRGTNYQLTGEGTVGPNMTRIWDDLIGHVEEGGYYGPALSGSAVETFKEYVRNLDRAVGGCGGIATALERYIEAQQQLWTAVPSNVSAIVSSITGACDALVGQQPGSGSISLQEVGVVLGGVSLAGGPIGMAATGAGLIITAIGSVKTVPIVREVGIESHEGALDVLDKLLNRSFSGFGVNEMIKTFERQTCAGIAGNIQEIDGQRDMYDLTPGTIETVDGVIRHDEEKADNISRRLDSVGVELGNVADRLGGCATELDPMFCTMSQAYGSSLLARDSRVGIGGNGPTDDLVTLTGLLKSILTELSGEVLAGAVNFKAAMDALDWTNSETRSSLMVAAESFGLADQGGIDSFDFHPWSAAGRIEAAERVVSEAAAGLLGLSEGSSDSADTTHGSPTHSYPNADGRSATRWREWPNGLDLRTDQPCDAEPNDRQADDEVVIRPQPDRR